MAEISPMEVINALYQRPSLKLEITGFTDPEQDTEALRTSRMKGLLVAEKIKDLSRTGDQPVRPGAVQITGEEYPVYLKKAYKSGKFAKPRNVLGMVFVWLLAANSPKLQDSISPSTPFSSFPGSPVPQGSPIPTLSNIHRPLPQWQLERS